MDHFEARIVRDIAAAMRWTSPRKETYHHITNTMRCGQGGGSHWVAVVLEIEKTERPEATAAAAGTAVVQQHETPHVYSQTRPDAPVKVDSRDSLSQQLFASSSSSSSTSSHCIVVTNGPRSSPPGLHCAAKQLGLSLADRAACSGYAGVSIQGIVPGFLTERSSSS